MIQKSFQLKDEVMILKQDLYPYDQEKFLGDNLWIDLGSENFAFLSNMTDHVNDFQLRTLLEKFQLIQVFLFLIFNR